MTVPAAILSRFLDNACPDHHVRGGPDHVRAEHTAMRLLARYPDIPRANFYSAVVCGDVEGVNRALVADPAWATRTNGEADPLRADGGSENDLIRRDWGTKGWQPLSYLCFTRLPLQAVARNAAAIASALLDNGADPNAYFMAGGSRYTPLVGVIGEGEEGRPGHPQRDALARLLLDRGAHPYDEQVIYNLHFSGRVLWFLEAVYGHSRRHGRAADWDDPEWRMFDMGGYGSGARWYLEIAIEHDDLALAEWCLAHGASPNAAPARRRPGWERPLYDEAMLRGRTELADLLVRRGAIRTATALDPRQKLLAACRTSDTPTIRDGIEKHPAHLESFEPLFAAAKHNQQAAAELLLDLGTSPDIENPAGERALHIAAYDDSVDVAALLIARGAEVDPIGRRYQNTPLGGAMHCQSLRVIELLCNHSRSIWELGYAGSVDRVRRLLAEKPEAARATGDGETLLMWLPPHDESKALELAQLLLDHGADASVRDPRNLTAADRAELNGMFDVAALLRARES
jgi:ankyrin repeat protein